MDTTIAKNNTLIKLLNEGVRYREDIEEILKLYTGRQEL